MKMDGQSFVLDGSITNGAAFAKKRILEMKPNVECPTTPLTLPFP